MHRQVDEDLSKQIANIEEALVRAKECGMPQANLDYNMHALRELRKVRIDKGPIWDVLQERLNDCKRIDKELNAINAKSEKARDEAEKRYQDGRRHLLDQSTNRVEEAANAI